MKQGPTPCVQTVTVGPHTHNCRTVQVTCAAGVCTITAGRKSTRLVNCSNELHPQVRNYTVKGLGVAGYAISNNLKCFHILLPLVVVLARKSLLSVSSCSGGTQTVSQKRQHKHSSTATLSKTSLSDRLIRVSVSQSTFVRGGKHTKTTEARVPLLA